MNTDKVLALAKEAHGPITGQWFDMDIAALTRFAALIQQQMEAENAELRKALQKQAREALDDVDSWSSYASDYFKAKWNLEADLNKWRERAAIDQAMSKERK